MSGRTNPADADVLREKIRNFLHVTGLAWKTADKEAGASQNFLAAFLLGRKNTMPYEYLDKIGENYGVPRSWWRNAERYPPSVTQSGPTGHTVEIRGYLPGKRESGLGTVEVNAPSRFGKFAAWRVVEDHGYIRRGDVVITAGVGIEPRAGVYCLAESNNTYELAVADRKNGEVVPNSILSGQSLEGWQLDRTVVQVHRSMGQGGAVLVFTSEFGLGPSDFEKLI